MKLLHFFHSECRKFSGFSPKLYKKGHLMKFSLKLGSPSSKTAAAMLAVYYF